MCYSGCKSTGADNGYPNDEGIHPPDGHYGLRQPICIVLDLVKYPGCGLLHGGSGEGFAKKTTGDLQLRPRCPVTSQAFTGCLEAEGIRISMDVRSRVFGNIFIERSRRTVKYEEVA